MERFWILKGYRPKKESKYKTSYCNKCPKCGQTPAWYYPGLYIAVGCYQCGLYVMGISGFEAAQNWDMFYKEFDNKKEV